MIISNSITISDYEFKNLINKFLVGDVISVEVSEPMFASEEVIIEYENFIDLNNDLKYLELIKCDYSEINDDFNIEVNSTSLNNVKLKIGTLRYFSKIFKDIGLFEIDGVEGDGYGTILIFGNSNHIEEDILKNLNKEEITDLIKKNKIC